MIKIICVVGARPNFVKIAPLLKEMEKYRQIEPILVHTGQHYDFELSKIFFDNLNILKPDYNLEVGSGSHAWQTAKIIERLEPVILKEKPNFFLVVGDVNSTLAGALCAAKLNIPVIHVEAGLRSFDKRMPEEINRKLTDHLSDFLFCTEPTAIKNLLDEGISRRKIFYVGNVMIDTFRQFLKKDTIVCPRGGFAPGEIRTLDGGQTLFRSRLRHSAFSLEKAETILAKPARGFFQELFSLKRGLKPEDYAVLTLHRAENVDDKIIFREILEAIGEVQKKIKIIWPIHPRAEKQLGNSAIKQFNNLNLIKPLGYSEMLNLMKGAKFVLTDSGGIQEETTVLGIPCLTLRENTERPITCDIGTNIVCGTKKKNIVKEAEKILAGKIKSGKIPRYWDGKTSERIIKRIVFKVS